MQMFGTLSYITKVDNKCGGDGEGRPERGKKSDGGERKERSERKGSRKGGRCSYFFPNRQISHHNTNDGDEDAKH